MNNILANFTSSSIVAELSTIALVLLSISVLFWFLIGRFRLHNALINIYISFAILQVVPKNIVSFDKLVPLIVFLALIIFLTFVDRNIFEIHLSGSGLSIWQVVILSFLEAGLLVSIVASLLPQKQVLNYISPASLDYFISPLGAFLWVIAPLIFLVLIGRR